MNGIKDQLPEKNLKGNFKEAVPQKITYSFFHRLQRITITVCLVVIFYPVCNII